MKLVLCVDRDDDLGRKAGIDGPVVGREENLKAAVKLLSADPEDSDGNTIFAAVKIYDQLKRNGEEVEIATITGDPDEIKADIKLNSQLRDLLESLNFDEVILVTDGAHDDQTVPIIQNYAPIISKRLVLVKQARELERTYFVLLNALKEPSIARMVLGLPGVFFLLYFLLGGLSIKIFMGLLGVYLIAKGFGLEERFFSTMRWLTSPEMFHRVSFPFYLAVVPFILLGLVTTYYSFAFSQYDDLVMRAADALRNGLPLFALSGLSATAGKILDAHYLKRAYKMRKYLTSLVSVIAGYWITDVLLLIILGKYSLEVLLLVILVSVLALSVTYWLTGIFETEAKLSSNIVNAKVVDRRTMRRGRVLRVLKDERALEVRIGRRIRKVPVEKVHISKGVVYVG